MKAYRYNAMKRTDRKYNTCGTEKNPCNVKFYSKSLQYAKNYRYIYFDNGDINYECSLETIEIPDEMKLFDMERNFAETKAYKIRMDYLKKSCRETNERDRRYAKTKKDLKLIENNEKELSDGTFEKEEVKSLVLLDFQALSDFELQKVLVDELKGEGYDGYETKKEIAIF